jgi:hypothetical protein
MEAPTKHGSSETTRGEGLTMNEGLSFKTAVCTEYERLLHECQRALEAWRNRRDQVAKARLTGKQIGDELQMLQANYAKAYANLNKHDRHCELCQFVSRIGGRQYAAASNSGSEKNRAN